jgi:hypothetical protein
MLNWLRRLIYDIQLESIMQAYINKGMITTKTGEKLLAYYQAGR